MSINPNTILDELASDKITLICSKHNYVPTKKRAVGSVAIPPNTRGCKDCWFAYYVADMALTPPSKRQERLDELESVIKHAIEYEQKGQFGKDLELFEPTDERFRVEFEKDGAPDKKEEN